MNAKASGALSLGKYEAKRLRRIEENRRMLLSLNLPTIPRRAKPAPVPKQTQRAEPVMRSGRLRQESIQARQKKRQQDIIMRLQALQLARLQQKQALQLARLQRKQKREHNRRENQREQEFQQALKKYPPTIDLPFVYPCQLKSSIEDGKQQNLLSSSLEMELDTFHSRCLGIQLLPVGKQTVVEALCPPEYTTQFSTMNNVHVWKNAITLLVSEECDVPYSRMLQCESTRVFFDWGARTQRQEISSEMVQQLQGNEELRLNDSYYASEEPSATPVLLFLQHAKGPYIYCGQIGYLGYRYESDSVKFRWQLMDAAAMDWVGLLSVLCS
ncbi:hypothetical protein GQ600_6883 [Phytophthora cactorum]|nr:hypothetical protein GQ600_6883 [Phytophthora cactorum]